MFGSHVGNQAFGPSLCLLFALFIQGHFLVGGIQILRQNMRLDGFLQEGADMTASDASVQPVIHFFADGDG